MEFKLAYYNFTVHHYIHYTTKTTAFNFGKETSLGEGKLKIQTSYESKVVNFSWG